MSHEKSLDYFVPEKYAEQSNSTKEVKRWFIMLSNEKYVTEQIPLTTLQIGANVGGFLKGLTIAI